MEDLTKTQLVLLALLLSFVTSIATGIMTSSLLQGSPTSVTQTINRVVERTIEKVSDSSGSTVTKEIQVVSEDDKITSAIINNTPAIVSIRQIKNDGSSSFYSIGLVVSKDGDIVAERTPAFSALSPYSALFSDNSTLSLTLTKDLPDAGLVTFKVTNGATAKFTPISFTNTLPKLGQTVVLIEGVGSDATVLVGRIANIQGDSSTTPKTLITDINSTKDYPGAPILDLSGNVMGIRRSDTQSSAFYFGQRIQSAILK